MTFAKLISLALITSGLLAGSPAMAASAPSFDLSGLLAATTADLEAAKSDANARGDTIASQCYSAIEAHLAANPLPDLSLPSPVGVVSAFQGARDAVKNAQKIKAQLSGGIPQDLEIGCGPLALDVQSDLGQAVKSVGLLSALGL